MKKAGKYLLYIMLVVTVVITIVLTINRAAAGREFTSENSNSGIIVSKEDSESIKVYVTGEVETPGIIELGKGSTILDAVEKCGGFTVNASSNINLVYQLEKNVTIVIKSADDGGGADIMEEAGDVIIINDENGIIDGAININNADIASLSLLPGVGEKTALDIIAYRESSGAFECIEDLMNVPGIKESKFSKLKDLICVD